MIPSKIKTIMSKTIGTIFSPLMSGRSIWNFSWSKSPIDPTLITWLPLNGNTLDATPNGNDGTYQGTPSGTVGYYSAGHNQALAGYFNGSDNYISMPNSCIDMLKDFTVSCWCEKATGGNRALFYFHDSNGNRFLFYPNESRVYWNINTYLTDPLTTGWHNIVLTKTSSALRVFVDGALEANATASLGARGSTIGAMIGAYSGPSQFWNSRAEGFRIYNRILSDSEIVSLYTLGR